MTAKKKPEARIKSVKRVFDSFFKVDEYEVEADRHEGGTHELTRLVFERGHAVGILAYDPKADVVVMINEMRPGILAAGEYPYTDTVPAGGVKKGENALDVAVRETLEETGLELKNTEVIHAGVYVSPGGTSEKIALVFGTIDSSKAGGVHGEQSESEDILTRLVKSDEFIRQAESGELTDMKTVLAAYWLARNKDRIAHKHAPSQKKHTPKI